jgi:general L-amino acid transport system substrate-binding protein
VKRSIRSASIAIAVGLVLAACGGDADTAAPSGPSGTVTVDPAQTGGSLLDAVKARGSLKCGVNTGLAGFAAPEGDTYVGFDADFCRAVAAAVLGDAEAIEWIPLSASARFTALQSGEIDVLIRNTTWTATRDGGEGAAFATTTFYDGQGMLVRSDSGFNTVDGHDEHHGLRPGRHHHRAEPRDVLRVPRPRATSRSCSRRTTSCRRPSSPARCDGWTSDLSQLAAFRGTWPDGAGRHRLGQDPRRTSCPRSRSAR